MAFKLDKAEIRQFFREEHINEKKQLAEFAENIQAKGMVSGCIAVEFSDGTYGFYDIKPCEQDEVLVFVQKLSSKRSQVCIDRQEEYR